MPACTCSVTLNMHAMRPIAVLLPLLVAFLLSIALPAHAQFGHAPEPDEAGDARIGLTGEAFLYNAEFDHPLKVGYTLPGWTLTPYMSYDCFRILDVSVGWRVTQMIGRRDPWRSDFLFSISSYPIQSLAIRLGALPEPHEHRLPDFLYSHQRAWLNRPEMGAHIRYEPLLAFYFAEAWLDWETFIWRGAKKNEQFFLGLQLARQSLRGFQGRLFFLAHHSGGQIDDTSLPVITSINTGGELGYAHFVGPTRLAWGVYAALSRDGDKTHPFYGRSGYAVRPYIGCSWNGLHGELAYFHALRFYTLRGQELYASYSDWSEGRHMARRQIVTARLDYSHSTSTDVVEFKAGTELFYDVALRRVDWAFFLQTKINFALRW